MWTCPQSKPAFTDWPLAWRASAFYLYATAKAGARQLFLPRLLTLFDHAAKPNSKDLSCLGFA